MKAIIVIGLVLDLMPLESRGIGQLIIIMFMSLKVDQAMLINFSIYSLKISMERLI